MQAFDLIVNAYTCLTSFTRSIGKVIFCSILFQYVGKKYLIYTKEIQVDELLSLLYSQSHLHCVYDNIAIS